MEQALAALEQRIAALEDIEAIRRLKARYLRGCDMKQPEAVRDTLLPDGAVIAYEGFPAFDNRDAFVAVFEAMGCQPGVHDIHHASNADITLVGPDRAEGKWSLDFRSIILAQRQVIAMGVEYHDVYVRQDGRWWIAETRSTRTGCLIEQVGEDGLARVVVMGDPPAAYGEG